MKAARRHRPSAPSRSPIVGDLRSRLSEAEATLRAIRSGGVDALVVSGDEGPRVYTLEGAEHAYRVLIESMNEGALTLSPGAVILYANERFARMVKRPLDRVIGRTFHGFLSPSDRAALRALLKTRLRSGSRLQASLRAGDGSTVPAQISVRPVRKNASPGPKFGMVVTDMTESRRSQELLQDLSHRLAQAQESERDLMAIRLSDDIAQSLVVILLRFQVLVNNVPAHAWPPREAVVNLSKMLGETAEEVERLSRNLRPSVLKHLGLAAALGAANRDFERRTGVRIKLACAELSPPPPAESALALYRIFEEALRNAEMHARARHVSVRLTQRGAFAEMAIKDDGIGFEPGRALPSGTKGGGLGFIRMRERAEFLGAALTIKTGRRSGTEVGSSRVDLQACKLEYSIVSPK